MKIEAVIWDMDGVLIDSEPFWQAAEIATFSAVGLHMTHEESSQTMGLRLDAAVQYWFDRRPWQVPPTVEQMRDKILDHVIDTVEKTGGAMAGVVESLDILSTYELKMAIASSSYMRLIKAVVQRLGIASYFDLLYSAEYETYGKPHPGVYITTAQKLGVPPQGCLVIEDSMRGILAAKAAEMKCLAVPDPSLRGDSRLSIADVVLPSLQEADATFWQQIIEAE